METTARSRFSFFGSFGNERTAVEAEERQVMRIDFN